MAMPKGEEFFNVWNYHYPMDNVIRLSNNRFQICKPENIRYCEFVYKEKDS